jgi:hypothetical protein
MGSMRIFFWILFGCMGVIIAPVASVLAASPTSAMESLLMPGELSKPHARYENDCSNCHENFKKASQNKKCRKCHEDIDEDIKSKKGFHGHVSNIEGRECKTCHTEHRGRDRRIAAFDQEVFDHDKTDFELKGWHVQVACAGCHHPKAKFREAPVKCISCHREDDKHKARMGKACNNCHVEKTWKIARFDHDKTDFKLKGAHIDVGCVDCHPNERYENTPMKCFFCHELDDEHKGNRGKKCDNCHEEKGWLKVKFDHDKDTKFKLRDMHAKLQCNDCHKDNVYEKALKTTCVSCHDLSDKHKGRYGKECNVCHATESWKRPLFDHNEDTNFRIRGEHKDVSCDNCHPGMLFDDKVGGNCYSCHRLDDVHGGQEGKACQQCHDERGWDAKVVFDHDITKFPLLGAHLIVPCEECHLTTTYKDAEIDCVSCHKKDDVHKKRLGKQCKLCHVSYDWLVWEFDHDKQTDFPLDGAHKGIDCHACHKEPVEDKIELSTICYSCHKKDDNHDGNLGTKCDKCHVTSSFKKRKLI